MTEELAGPWLAQAESRLRQRRGHDRQRAPGAGPCHDLVFAGPVVVTLAVLRFQLPHTALALFYGTSRWTVGRAVSEIRTLLAAREFAVPDQPGLRLRTLDDVFAYAQAEGGELPLDGTEIQVRRPRTGHPGRRAFVSGKKMQNTTTAAIISDGQGRLIIAGAFRPGRMHEVTQVRTEGIEETLSAACQGMGRFGEAVGYSRQAPLIVREIGDRHREGITLTKLGAALCADGRTDGARRCRRDALAILEGLASPKAAEVRMLLENSKQAKRTSMLSKASY